MRVAYSNFAGWLRDLLDERGIKSSRQARVRTGVSPAIVRGLIDTGCRIGEMLALTVSDLDRERMRIQIRETKTDTPRTVPISRGWLPALDDWLRLRPRKSPSECLFVSTFGTPVDASSFARAFRRYRELAGLPASVNRHSLRHYTATALAQTDFKGAMDMLGHRDPKTTARYAHSREEHNASVHAAADPLAAVTGTKGSAGAKPTRRRELN